MAGKHIPHLTILTNHKQKSYPFAVLSVCMQEFLILISQLSFSIFFVPLNCFEIEQLAPHNHFWGTKQIVPAKQRKDGAFFWYSSKTKAKRAK